MKISIYILILIFIAILLGSCISNERIYQDPVIDDTFKHNVKVLSEIQRHYLYGDNYGMLRTILYDRRKVLKDIKLFEQLSQLIGHTSNDIVKKLITYDRRYKKRKVVDETSFTLRGGYLYAYIVFMMVDNKFQVKIKIEGDYHAVQFYWDTCKCMYEVAIDYRYFNLLLPFIKYKLRLIDDTSIYYPITSEVINSDE